MLLHELILSTARTHGSRPALTKAGLTLDYDALGAQLRIAAAGLTELGVRDGERVAIYLNKRIESVLAYFAASYAGAVFVPINPGLKAAQVKHILNDCDVVTLITTSNQVAALGDAPDHHVTRGGDLGAELLVHQTVGSA